MNIKDFEYLSEIASQESISKAAARLYLSQPTLTKFLQKKEEEFGTLLFHRIGKRMVPTPAGIICIEKSRKILEMNEEIDKEVNLLRQIDCGYIRIGIQNSRAHFFVTEILPVMKQKFPHFSVVLNCSTKTSLLNLLEQGELDIVFVSNSAERPYLNYIPIFQEAMVLVVPEKHELLSKAVQKPGFQYPYVAINDWNQYPFILASIQLATGQYTKLLFEHYQLKPDVVLEITGSLHYIYTSVAQGLGIAIAPSIPLSCMEDKNIQYLSFEDDRNITWIYTAITRGQISHSPAISALIELVKLKYR